MHCIGHGAAHEPSSKLDIGIDCDNDYRSSERLTTAAIILEEDVNAEIAGRPATIVFEKD